MKCQDFLVLLVEDDPDQVLLMKEALARVNLVNPLQVAEDGEEAIAYLSGEGVYADRKRYPLPSLVLLDLKLPRISGLEVLEWLRKQPPFRNLPVVVLTASSQGSDVHRAYALGVNSYLLKPVGFADLTEMMKSIGMYWMILNKAPDAPRGTRAAGSAADGPCVLVVDTDPDFLEVVPGAFLRRVPALSVHTVTAAAEALERIRRGECDAVVCARDIPEVASLAFLREARASRTDLPIFVVMGEDDPEFSARAISEGARAVFKRPTRLNTLLDQLHKAVLEAAPSKTAPPAPPAAKPQAAAKAPRRTQDTEIMGDQIRFQKTSWDLVRSSTIPESMEALIQAYWKPLYFFVRQRGFDNETAKDIIQEFFTTVLERRSISKADPARGRFRTFLLAALTNFLKDRAKEASRQKRGGGKVALSLDFARGESDYKLEVAAGESPERIVDRTWARSLLQCCVDELQGDPVHLKAFSLYYKGEPYESIMRQTGLSESAAKTAVHRLKGQLREIVTRHIGQTAATEEEFQEELSEFLSILSESSKDGANTLTLS